MMDDFERHGEIARAKSRALIAETYEAARSLVGWMNTAGYDPRDMQRANEAVSVLGALFDTIVVVHEEAEIAAVAELDERRTS